ncbi:carbohydrate ABC transporter permease [Streptomyces litchfieldiae]|uniref:Sugar ABC transporter permease n=1 Tax=Streptomyces litchfieldiae TaxID=3075543 RepID=A0ABU2MLT1_9ACTN|nr:sugar ABC transporter permease [Streptomyces sp. DSM 44938]MDT0342450.1 sugar ABC transporter permease [Streptomyces sp. DSM 44938]
MATLTSPGRAKRRQRHSGVLLLLGPFLLLFGLTYLVPLCYAVVLSFFRERFSGIGWDGPRRVFAGFDNYTRALTDEEFLTGVGRVLLYGGVYVPVLIALAAVLALLLDTALVHARRFFHTLLFLPHIVPGLIAAIIWLYLYTPGLSPIIDGLDSLGWHVDFLGSAGGVLFSLVNVAIWGALGFNVILIFVGLQAVPRTTIDAARIDGAGELRIAFSVKLPQVRPTVMVATLFTIIGSLQLYTEPMILRTSGESPIDTAWTPNMLAYASAFNSNDYHYAATVSVLIAVLAGVLSYAVTRFASGRALR